MTYPVIVLKKASEKLKERQAENKIISKEKRDKLYRELPELLENSKKIAGLMKLTLASGQSTLETKKQLSELISERESVLLSHGYSSDYLEDYYECPICRDEGFVNGQPCECYLRLIKKEAYLLSNIGERIEKENFDTFSLQIHSDQKNMEAILHKTKLYCENSPQIQKNILFTGPTGTGKTFLSSCIAREFLQKGKFVFYLTATQISNLIDDAKFRRDTGDSQAYLDLIKQSDVLIIDDLGTEYAFGYPQSQLFDILETRMVTGKRTVISTNMNLNEINQKYSPRLVSRILGNYEVFVLNGQDLRYQAN